MYAIKRTDEYLEHHGILGQRWGVRRYQNPDGTLTPEGRKRLNIENSKYQTSENTHKSRTYNSYKERGYSDEAALTAAKNKIRVEKALMVVGTVAITAATVYTGKKICENYLPRTIKAGKIIQNVADNKTRDVNNAFFGAHKTLDKIKYRGLLGGFERQGIAGNDIFNQSIKVIKDVKIAPNKVASDTLADLMKNDKNFREEVKSIIYSQPYRDPKRIKLFSKATKDVMNANSDPKHYNSKNLYKAFESVLANPDARDGVSKQFYEALRSKGYQGILDNHDKHITMYKTNSPIVYFGGSDYLKFQNGQKMTQKQMTKDMWKSIGILQVQNNAKTAGAVVAGKTIINNYKNTKAIEKYLDEHPNSKLSREEILEIVSEKK